MMPNKSIVGVTCGLLCCLMRIVMFVVSRNDLIKEIRPRDKQCGIFGHTVSVLSNRSNHHASDGFKCVV